MLPTKRVYAVMLAAALLLGSAGCQPFSAPVQPTPAIVQNNRPTSLPTVSPNPTKFMMLPNVPARRRPTPTLATATPTAIATSTRRPTFTLAPRQTETPGPPTAVPTGVPTYTTGQGVRPVQISMFDDQNGWAIARDPSGNGQYINHVLHTRDGGSTWKDVTPPFGSFTFNNFVPLDGSTAHAGIEWFTTDGGQSWQALNPSFAPPLESMEYGWASSRYQPDEFRKYEYFINPQTGWILWDDSYGRGKHSVTTYFARTVDGGKDWSQSMLGGSRLYVYSGIIFISETDGFVSPYHITDNVSEEGMPKLQDYRDGKIFPELDRTTDGGNRWEDGYLPKISQVPAAYQSPEVAQKWIAQCDVDRLFRVPGQGLVAQVGCRLFDPHTRARDSFSVDYYTLDGGQTWRTFLATGSEYFVDDHQGWRLAPGQLQHTLNGGQDWIDIKPVIWENASFSFVNALHGWAVVNIGNETALLETKDSGKNWIEIKPVITR